MNDLNEKIAYLAGMAKGLEIDSGTKEGKLLTAIVDVLVDISSVIKNIDEDIEELTELVYDMDEDLGEIETEIYGEDEDEDEDDFFEVKCPKCGENVFIDEDAMFGEEDLICPNCNEKVEFGCDCGCDCCE